MEVSADGADKRGLWRRLALKPESAELLHLDLMRFVASLGVLVLHSHLFLFPEAARPYVESKTHNLGLFVDLFFVISGFVISYVYSGRVHSAREFGKFIQRRVGRLFPLHLATMAAAIAVTLIVLAVGAPYNSMPSFSPRCVVSTIFLVQEIAPCGGTSFNGVNWSISVEMALYAVFPLLLLVTRKSAIIAAIFPIMILGALLWSSSDFDRAWYFGYQPVRGLASFAFGMGLYHLRGSLGRLPFSALGLMASTVVMVVAMTTGAPTLLCLALVYLTSTLAVAADAKGIVHPLVLRLAPLGQLTYSLYMIHWTVFLVLLAGVGDKILELSTIPMLGLVAVSFAIVFGLSLLSFHFFETPLRRWIDRRPVFSSLSGAAANANGSVKRDADFDARARSADRPSE